MRYETVVKFRKWMDVFMAFDIFFLFLFMAALFITRGSNWLPMFLKGLPFIGRLPLHGMSIYIILLGIPLIHNMIYHIMYGFRDGRELWSMYAKWEAPMFIVCCVCGMASLIWSEFGDLKSGLVIGLIVVILLVSYFKNL